MKLGVDIRWMVGNYRGMGRFARQLIAPVNSSVVGLAPRGIAATEWSCVSQGNSFFPWWEQKVLPQLCRREQLDFLLCPYNTGPLASLGSTRAIAVIHDLIFMQPWSVLPPSMSFYQTLGRLYRRQVVPAFARRADTILTVSHFTKNELVERFGLPESAVHVIPNAIADDWFETPLPLDARLPYLFTVAGEAPSKNVSRLLKAFALALPTLDAGITLKIAGIKPAYHQAFSQQANQLGIAGQVELLGFLSDQQLRQYYRQAKAFVFASLFEGFGIPLLEAMASGTPVACSNSTSMPEVVGSYGVQFDPISVEDMAEKIRYLCSSAQTLSSLAKGGLERAQGYSESMVAQSMNVFWSKLS